MSTTARILCDVVESDRGCGRRLRHRADPITTVLESSSLHHRVALAHSPRMFDENGEYLSKTVASSASRRPVVGVRMVRRRHRALRHPRQRDHRLLPDQARRAVGLETVRCASATVSTETHSRDAIPKRSPRAEPSTRNCRAGGKTSRRARVRRPACQGRDYVLRLEELGGAHISCIAVGPGETDHRASRLLAAARDGFSQSQNNSIRLRPSRRSEYGAASRAGFRSIRRSHAAVAGSGRVRGPRR